MPLFTFPNHNKAKICVIGHMMLDHYINASCDAIPPEVPVQVDDVKRDDYSFGVWENSNR